MTYPFRLNSSIQILNHGQGKDSNNFNAGY